MFYVFGSTLILQHMKRAGWVLRDVKDCETVAGHMYRMSIMTFLLEGNKDGLNRSKCLELGELFWIVKNDQAK